MKNKQLASLKTLIIWVILVTLMIGGLYFINYLNINSNKKQEKEIVDKTIKKGESVLSYFDKLHKLLNDNYEFNYVIIKNSEKIKFEGIKKNGIIEGYKQDAFELIKYKIENQKIYKVLIDKNIEITNLYEGIDSSLLDLNYIIGILTQIAENEVIITEEEFVTTYAYNMTKEEEEIEIKVIENNEYIEKISIKRNNEIYELNYKSSL